MKVEVPLEEVTARAYTVPTDKPEADGTLSWTDTTLIVVEVNGGGKKGLGYTYAAATNAELIRTKLKKAIEGHNVMDVPGAFRAMQVHLRNFGRAGLGATALSAVDTALWDLKAKLLDLPLVTLLGAARGEIEIYGSGGFTSYTDEELQRQLAGWVLAAGCHSVKMKVGSQPERDPQRVAAARAAIGDKATLFVDGNGAYSPKQALLLADIFAESDVRWFEEPVSSDDLAGLQYVRQRAPARINIAAGEYGYEIGYFRRMLNAGAVDVQQADITRCGGVTGFLQVGALCEAHHIDLSGHCAPSLHLHAACAVPRFRNLEWFHDHVRIEHMLFDGAPEPKGGMIKPDLSRPGFGLDFRRQDAEQYAAG